MKRLSFLLLATVLLAGCSGITTSSQDSENSSGTSEGISSSEDTSQSSSSSSELPPEEEDEGLENLQDAPIFHAWDWSISDVKSELNNIAASGFKAIQLSPLQPSKDINSGDAWWNLYQPMGFKVATGNENPLGNKNDLTSLCADADEKGVAIIMDVVCNHLAQGAKYQLFTSGEGAWSGNKNVTHFEPKICSDNLIHTDGYEADSDSNNDHIIKGSLGGLPDLKTENEYVQERVISMLKEYIDCGVKGFRFDAAKHIETPSDGGLGSQFWPNVVESINAYGQEVYEADPYVYGEILYRPGYSRSWDWYTPYMSVTEASQGKDMVESVASSNISGMTNGHLDMSNNKAVLWAESHDTWAHPGEYAATTNYSDEVVNLTYAIQTSRKDTATLYFSRPQNRSNPGGTPQVVGAHDEDYKSSLIKGINTFHNLLLGANESFVNSNNQAAVIVRKSDKNEGAFIANPSFGSSLASVNVNGLSDGTYVDLISNKSYTVSSGQVSNVTFTDGGCALVKYPDAQNKPSIVITPSSYAFTDSTNVSISVKNGTSMSYKVNGENETGFTNSVQFNVGSSFGNNTIITITVNASNSTGNSERSITIYKTNLLNKNFVIYNVPNNQVLRVWNWNDDPDAGWVELESFGPVRASDNVTKNNYIIVKFDAGDAPDWAKSKGQTVDSVKSGKVYVDYNEITFK